MPEEKNWKALVENASKIIEKKSLIPVMTIFTRAKGTDWISVRLSKGNTGANLVQLPACLWYVMGMSPGRRVARGGVGLVWTELNVP